MKQANQLLLWLIGLPIGAVIWIAMVGPKVGITTISLAAICVGFGLLTKNRKES